MSLRGSRFILMFGSQNVAVSDPAPTLSNATGTATSDTEADLSVDTDIDDGTLYWVVTTSDTAPSAAQVKAGQDHTGSAAADSGSQAVSGTGTQNVSGGATGLTAATAYYAHFMQEKAGGQQSNVETSESFTTDSAYEAESELIFDAFTTPPTDTRKGLINDVVVALKADGVWTKLDALYMFAAADSQAALINWKDPGTFNATAVNSPAFAADEGFTGNGSSAYITSGFVPSTAGGVYSQNSAHLGARSLTSVAASGTNSRIVGNLTSTTPRSTFSTRDTGDLFGGRLNHTTYDTVSNADSSGHFIFNRSASNAMQYYRNGSSLGTDSTASTGLPTSAVTFLADTQSSTYGILQAASGSIGASLDATEANALEDAEFAYMQGVGAVA